MEFEQIKIDNIEEMLIKINDCFENLRKSIEPEIQKSLEYNIYYLSEHISELNKRYVRNVYRLNKEFDKQFLSNRNTMNSDLATTKKVKKDMIKEFTDIETQEQVIEWLKDRKKDIHRLANFIESERIGELAMAKRQNIL